MARRDTRLVVVGYGMGSYHARLIAETPELTLHGVCDVQEGKRKQALSEHPGVKLYTRYEDVLADAEVDLVVIVTPHNAHARMAVAAMAAGKHAITDKAMCLTVAEAKEMIAARDRKGLLLSTFHNRRWDRDFVTVRKVLKEGLLGRLYHIDSSVTSVGSPGGWRADRAQMGGWLYDWGAHTLDQILALAVPAVPVRTYATAHHRFADPSTVEDLITCTVTFDTGLTAATTIGYLNHVSMPRWYIVGENASLFCEDFEKPLRVKGTIAGVHGDLTVPLVGSEWQGYYQNIADTLAGRADLTVKPEQLVPQIAVAEAAYRSIESGQAQKVEW